MKGYKIFVRRRPTKGGTGLLGWHGPYYRCPPDWRIRAGAFLLADLQFSHVACGPGVNFWTTKAVARRYARVMCRDYGKKNVCVYTVETAPGAVVLRGRYRGSNELWDKARTTKLKLLKRTQL